MVKYLQIMNRIVQSIILRFISIFIRRKDNFVAFGSWGGQRFVDNSRYLAEYISKTNKDISIFWIGDTKIKEEVKKKIPNSIFLPINKFSSNLKLLKCKYMFFSQMHGSDISQCNVYYNAVLCYLHHGMPIKKWGADGLDYKKDNRISTRIIDHITGRSLNYDYFATSSALHDKTNCTALSFRGCTESKNIHSGTPRNDMLVNYDSKQSDLFKKEYLHQWNVQGNKTIILYLPTYRRNSENVFSFTTLSKQNFEKIENLLKEHNAVIIEKSHFAEKTIQKNICSDYIITENRNSNVQEMLLFTNILISDYSGAYLDYLLLDRPIIHYVYDYEYYKNVDSGLYYDIEDFSAGFVAYTFEELIESLSSVLEGIDPYKTKREYVKNKYMTYEIGKASEIITKNVLKC